MPFFEMQNIQNLPLVEGINVKAIYGEQCSVSFLELAPLSHLPAHHHENEQIGIILEGEVEYTIGEETKLCRKGSAFLIPPNTTHSCVVVSRTPAKLVDIFAPPRDLNKPLSYTG